MRAMTLRLSFITTLYPSWRAASLDPVEALRVTEWARSQALFRDVGDEALAFSPWTPSLPLHLLSISTMLSLHAGARGRMRQTDARHCAADIVRGLPRAGEGEGVCPGCWAKLSFIAPPFCPRLGVPFVLYPRPGHALDGGHRQPASRYARARAGVRYDDVAPHVHALKYQDRTDLAPAMAAGWRRAGRELSMQHARSRTAALAARMEPPLQSIGRAGAHDRAATGVAVAAERSRIRRTEQRIGLSRPQRAGDVRRVQGCARPAAHHRPQPRGADRRRVDVGATVDACARALLRAKAASVDVLVFARVVDSHRTPV